MDVVLMQFAAETQTAAPPKGQGKPATSQGKDGGEFGAMFAGLVADGQPQNGEAKKPDAEAQAAGETVQVFAPGMWNVAALMVQAPLTATVEQTAALPSAQDTTGAITPLPATAGQTAQPTQTLPLPQLTAPVTFDAGQQTLPEAIAQPAEQKPATQVTEQVQQAPVLSVGQTMPTRPQLPQMPVMTTAPLPTAPAPTSEAQAAPLPTAPAPTSEAQAAPLPTAPAPTSEAQEIPIPTAAAIPAPAEKPDTAATGQETAAERQIKPTVITPATITAAIAGGPRQTEKPAVAQDPVTAVEGEAEVQPRIAPAAAMTVAASGETQTTGDDSAAFSTENFPPAARNAAPPPETATANQLFAALVDQTAGRANAAESMFAAAGNQGTTSAQDPYNVAGQIVDNARLITRAENSEMVIRLKPEHLGELTLKIVVDSGVVSATFHAKNAEVRAAIEASLPQLRHDMANQGLKVDNVGVYTGLDQFFANDQRHAPQQQMPQTARRPSEDAVFADTAAAVTALGTQNVSGGSGIDYRI
ncbi:MAG: flagellar hook-length control protein FliK [Sporomusaceae bacterium]|nr:flagellar hook-length control protein FliK [Sporomusaceae bacterium]